MNLLNTPLPDSGGDPYTNMVIHMLNWVLDLDWLQWVGTIAIVWAYWYYVRRPFLATCITIAGCLAVAEWAYTRNPVAYGIITLELSVIGISLRNLWIAGKPTVAAVAEDIDHALH